MRAKVRDVACVLLGAAVLLLKGRYAGPGEVLVHSCAGNVAISFAVYFIVADVPALSRFARLQQAALALAAVEIFEVTDGFFGVMSNVYDPLDLLANAVGIAIAVAVDAVTDRAWLATPKVNRPAAAGKEER